MTATITATDDRRDRSKDMNTNTLAAGVTGFLLGGLIVSTAAELEDHRAPAPSHGSS